MDIAGLRVEPGRRAFAMVNAAYTTARLPIDVPVNVIRGSRDGPTLAVTCAVHGAELVGTFGLLRVLQRLDERRLRGTLIAIPVANTSAYEFGTRHTPWDGKILNRVGLGDPAGTITERLAHLLYGKLLPRADAWIDIHSGGPDGYIYYTIARHADAGDERARLSMEMAAAFGLPDIAVETPWHDAKIDLGIPTITPEMGGGADFYRSAHEQIETCARGIFNVMRLLGMLDEPLETPGERFQLWNLHTEIVNGHHGGVLFLEVRRGDRVTRGQTFGVLCHPYTGEVLERIPCPADGTVINSGILWPNVKPGDWLGVLGDPVDVYEPSFTRQER